MTFYLGLLSRRIAIDIEDINVNQLHPPSITLCDDKIYQCVAKSYKNKTIRYCENIAKLVYDYESKAKCYDQSDKYKRYELKYTKEIAVTE